MTPVSLFVRRRFAAVLVLAAGLLMAAAPPQAARASGELANLIARFKADPRGPYAAIRWFCPDGTTQPAGSRCPTPGGLQHALLKPEVVRLAEAEGIYWGQILAGTPVEDFLDEAHHFSRLKQYQLERYLQRIDDGWIVRKARYYRGAVQFEDESAWGVAFLDRVLADDRLVETQFFLLRQAARDIPHYADDGPWNEIRARSQAVADALPAFMPLRIKLHGQPEPTDGDALRDFLAAHRDLAPALRADIERLIHDLEAAFRADGTEQLQAAARRLPRDAPSRRRIEALVSAATAGEPEKNPAFYGRGLADLLLQLRREIPRAAGAGRRRALVDLSNAVEGILFLHTAAWRPATLAGLLDKLAATATGCAGAGYLEMWEWNQAAPLVAAAVPAAGETDLNTLAAAADAARRIAEWGAAMVRAHYRAPITRWQAFEPLAAGFLDDRVRSGLLLPLGDAAAGLQAFTAGLAGSVSQVMEVADTGRIRGINPGYALGTLRVLEQVDDVHPPEAGDILVLPHAPPDLKPVAGIATVSEGNLVSHVQLLARNLGIPNAVLSETAFHALKPWSGQPVFYAVSPGGTVVLKPAAAMRADERSLVEGRRREHQRIRIPLDRIDLARTAPVSLTDLSAADSGRWCGPKAANLGQLKHDFPDHVADGFAIPFGAFRRHMDQPMPGSDDSCWQFLQRTFSGDSAETVILERLSRLRATMGRMAFVPGFQAEIRDAFRRLLGAAMDERPVFVRSDTNMEDLKDFTGAGLNLTVFNVRGEAAIFQAIRDVWASVYTERSYRWRQHFLTNPENVFPSIVILPTVDVDMSGVMITTGVGGAADDLTVAFSRGAGGAVEGQMAESYLLPAGGGARLLSPAREAFYTVLPAGGGTAKAATSFETPLLGPLELDRLRGMATTIRERLVTPGPWDIELGFRDDHIWLFQVRPYVENRQARANDYLNRLDPPPPENRSISMSHPLPSSG